MKKCNVCGFKPHPLSFFLLLDMEKDTVCTRCLIWARLTILNLENKK